MSILPANSNADYHGHILACVPLALTALQSFVGGFLHVVLPDSGLITIAGLDLAHEGGLQMIALAAWVGATQIVWALVLALVVLRYRNFTLPLLLLVVLEKALILLGQAIKPTGSEHTPPGIYGAMILLVLSLLAIFVAREKQSSQTS